MLNKGTVLQNRYRIAALLGQGGMGAVYRAWHLSLNMPLAIKEMVPQPGLDAATLSQLRQQFQREAGVLARLNHPSLVRVIVWPMRYCFASSNEIMRVDMVAGSPASLAIWLMSGSEGGWTLRSSANAAS